MIRIPVTIRSQGKDTVLLALIDSGAEGQFIHANLVDDLNLDTYQLAQPIAPRNADGTPNAAGLIHRYVHQPVKITDHFHPEQFLITGIGKEDLILGFSWLKRKQPLIDWQARTVSVNNVTIQEPSDLPTHIPDYCKPYSHVFSKEAAERFPPSRPYDHPIDLKPSFIPNTPSTARLHT